MEKSLRSSEWTILLSFLLILASLFIFTRCKIHKTAAYLAAETIAPEELIPVTFQGAVAKPGTYPAPPGTLLKNIIKKCRPQKNADLSSIDLNRRIEAPLELVIAEKKEILVWIAWGSEEPVALRLPLGARLCDLKSKIYIDPILDDSILKKRRLLQDGEEVRLLEKRD
jgi:hypothetical protein